MCHAPGFVLRWKSLSGAELGTLYIDGYWDEKWILKNLTKTVTETLIGPSSKYLIYLRSLSINYFYHIFILTGIYKNQRQLIGLIDLKDSKLPSGSILDSDMTKYFQLIHTQNVVEANDKQEENHLCPLVKPSNLKRTAESLRNEKETGVME